MLLKQRRVRRSEKFTSKFTLASRRRREYASSLFVTAIVQFSLFVFLIMGAIRAFAAMHKNFPDLSAAVTYAVPIGIFLLALITLKSCIGNIRYGADVYRRQREDRP